MKRFLALLTMLMCLCACASAEQAELSSLREWLDQDVAQPISELFSEETLITTVGTAQAAAANDIAVLSFSLDAKGETVTEANALMIGAIESLRAALAAQGVNEADIKQSRYDVSPDVAYHNTKMSETKIITGYIVELELTVRLKDISNVGAVIDAAMQSGAGSGHDLMYESSNAAQAYEAALAQAAQMAMDKAQLMAQSCGLELGDLVSVAEKSSQQDGYAAVEVTYRAK